MGLNLCFVMHFGCLKVYHFVLGYVSLFSSFPSSSPYLLKTDFCTWAVLLVAEWIPGSRENSLTILDSMTSYETEKWFLLVVQNKRRHFKTTFWFSVSLSWDTHLSRFFTFPICFKSWTTVEWAMFSSLATSHAVRRSASMMALTQSLSTSDEWSLRSSKALVSFAKLLEAPVHVRSLAAPGPNALCC